MQPGWGGSFCETIYPYSRQSHNPGTFDMYQTYTTYLNFSSASVSNFPYKINKTICLF